ncbi:MAG: hypothetical protein IT317_13590 [Anaerolineales bacterium]|nr:hypothetical protein [Anaerolineales bacterium]
MVARLLVIATLTLGLLGLTTPISSAGPPAQATVVAPGGTDGGKVPPSPEQVKQLVNADLSDFLTKLLTFQTEYFKTHGRFYQALDSHAVPPEDGKLVAPDLLLAGPTDQGEKAAYLWQQLALDAALPYAVRVDVYQGPRGWGYVLTVSATLDKQEWARTINTGPETWRESDWQAVVPVHE